MTEEQAVYDEIAEANRTAGGDMADRQVAKIHDYERKMERAREVVEGAKDTGSDLLWDALLSASKTVHHALEVAIKAHERIVANLDAVIAELRGEQK